MFETLIWSCQDVVTQATGAQGKQVEHERTEMESETGRPALYSHQQGFLSPPPELARHAQRRASCRPCGPGTRGSAGEQAAGSGTHPTGRPRPTPVVEFGAIQHDGALVTAQLSTSEDVQDLVALRVDEEDDGPEVALVPA